MRLDARHSEDKDDDIILIKTPLSSPLAFMLLNHTGISFTR